MRTAPRGGSAASSAAPPRSLRVLSGGYGAISGEGIRRRVIRAESCVAGLLWGVVDAGRGLAGVRPSAVEGGRSVECGVGFGVECGLSCRVEGGIGSGVERSIGRGVGPRTRFD